MKKALSIAGIVIAALGAIAAAVFAIPLACSMRGDNSSLGIIGGADGPTAIFVSTSPSPLPAVIAAAVAVAGIVTAAICYARAKRDKN